MGMLMERAGLRERLYNTAQLTLSRTKGALYIAWQYASIIFGRHRELSVIVQIELMDYDGAMEIRCMALQETSFIGCCTYSPLGLLITREKLHGGELGNLDWIDTRPLSDDAAGFSDINSGSCSVPKSVLNT